MVYPCCESHLQGGWKTEPGKGGLQHGRGRGQEMFTPPGYGDLEGKIPETPKLGHVELAMQGAARTSQLPLPTKNPPGPWSSMSSLPKIQ